MYGRQPNREMFIIKTLEKILQEREIKKSHHSQLRKACQDTLELARKQLQQQQQQQQQQQPSSPPASAPAAAVVGDNGSCVASASQQGSAAASAGRGSAVTSSALPSPRLASGAGAADQLDTEHYLLPLELACQSKTPRIIVLALDCIQKLIAYGHLVGDQPDPAATVDGRRQIDHIVQLVCDCFIGANTDEDVQLQILKAVLTVLTSQYVQIHEGSVLHAVRTCYSIYLASRNLINQTTAKATLTQVISVMFMRMEAQAASVSHLSTCDSHSSTAPASAAVTPDSSQSVDHSAVPTAPAVSADTDAASSDAAIAASTEHKPTDKTESEQSSSGETDSEQKSPGKTEPEQKSVDKTESEQKSADKTESEQKPVLSAGTESHCQTGEDSSHAMPSDKSVHVESASCHSSPGVSAVGNCDPAETINGAPAIAEQPDTAAVQQNSPHRQLLQPVQTAADPASTTVPDERSVNGCAGSGLSNGGVLRDKNHATLSSSAAASERHSLQESDEGCELDVTAHRFTHILQKDAFLVFRSLCKLSMKPLPDGPPDPKSHELRSKILSLELLLSILQSPGATFSRHDMFITAIKQYLCIALTKNGGSSVAEVFQLTLAIFLSLLANFKHHLKKQIEVFFKDIFLNLLGTSSSSFEHKWMVVQVLSRICADAQSVVDIYVNYDCDFDSANIFERLVNDLSRLAQTKQSHDIHSLQAVRDRSIQLKALECLVNILKCMVEWSRDLYINPQSQTNLDTGHESAEKSSNASVSESGGGGSGGASAQSDDASQYESLKQRKEVWEHGIDIFNRKPRRGLAFLTERGLLDQSAQSVAAFFHEDHRLDRAVLGDFLGDPDQFNREVMYAYVDQMNFSGLDFVAALRLFLEQFRLPGEAQKIDRLMEKFASRFCACNPNLHVFASADTAYVLAYSIIMLTTDLHSAQVKHKMTQQQYVKMNRGINDSQDLPEEYLCQIYDEIAGNEIKMKVVTTRPGKQPVAHSEKQRRTLFNMEMQQMSSAAKSLMEAASHVHAEFTSATHAAHVRPMFRAAWAPLLAAFSTGLQESDDAQLVAQCLHGFRCAVRIACIFNTTMERDAFVQALARFTLLTAQVPSAAAAGQMKAKNVDTIKTLIAVAQTDGNYLAGSWLDILRCVSQLELAQLVSVAQPVAPRAAPGASAAESGYGGGGATLNVTRSALSLASHGLHLFEEVGQAAAAAAAGGGSGGGGAAGAGERRLASVMESMGESSTQSVVVAVDRIFTGSIRLDGDSVVHFVDALCQVSRDELAQTPPRMFSLTKIVEISYYNMSRIRLQWSRIWRILGEHFNKVGSSAAEEVSFFAVDSLRQLAMKFIEKGELANFRFQKDFLRPFEYIMKCNRSFTIQDMVVRCIAQMVNSRAKNIRSGWNNIFSVFRLAASCRDDNIIELSFQTTGSIISNVFETDLAIVADSFQDGIKCLAEYACNALFPDISMEAIRLIRVCAKYVHEQPHLFRDTSVEDRSISEQDRVWVRGWFPIMFELSCVVNRCKLDVRTRALTVMFEIMKTYGATYRQHWWQDLFEIVFRIFDNMKLPEQRSEMFLHPDNEMDKAEWLTTTCNHALYAIVDVFSQYVDILQPILLDRLFSQLHWCVQQDNEQLARSGTNCLETLVISNGASFSAAAWQRTCACLVLIFRDTLPHQLLSWRPGSDQQLPPGHRPAAAPTAVTTTSTSSSTSSNQIQTGTASANSRIVTSSPSAAAAAAAAVGGQQSVFERLLIRCVVQLELIHTIDNVLFYPTASRRQDALIGAEARAAAAALLEPSHGVAAAAAVPVAPLDTDTRGMYCHLSCDQLRQLVECLLESHQFAASFNQNQEQRNLLWKAGFKGSARPNLLNQETQSLACCLRVLFRASCDPARAASRQLFQRQLLDTCSRSLGYYLQLQADAHRAAWTPLLLLIFSRLLKISSEQFREHVGCYYGVLCRLVACQTGDTVKALLSQCLQRVGTEYHLQPPPPTAAPAAAPPAANSAS